MEKEDWKKIIRWAGYVYIPIILLIIGIFILVEWNYDNISSLQQEGEVATGTVVVSNGVQSN